VVVKSLPNSSSFLFAPPQVDTVPWDLIRYPGQDDAEWNERMEEHFLRRDKVMREYTKKSVGRMWDMQVSPRARVRGWEG